MERELEDIDDVEFMAFPRMAGIAELGWSPAQRLSWDEYRQRLGAQGPRWDEMSVNYYRAGGALARVTRFCMR